METTAPATAIKPPLYVVLITGLAANGVQEHGTGFIVSSQGHVATCKHVVYSAADGQPLSQLRVKLLGAERPYSYQIKGTSPEDLAILESTVPLGIPTQQPMLHDDWASDTRPGDAVTAWGYSAQEHYTQAQCYDCNVSGLSETHGRIGLSGLINPGDSGGPVLDSQRRVIGIANARDANRVGQATAIPVSLLLQLLQEVKIRSEVAVEGDNDEVVFQVPLPPDHALVGREKLLRELKAQLADGRNVALCFKAAVGKSALATALANDPDLRARFEGGVLWASLNLTPNVLSELKKWGAALKLSQEKMDELEKLEPDPKLDALQARKAVVAHWAQALSEKIGQRRMLLVIDDAWELDPARALLLGAPNCGQLVTTREQSKVADMLGSKFDVTVVNELSPADGLKFLRQLAPNAVKMFPGKARTVFDDVGGMPLGLLLLGMYLKPESATNQRSRIEDAFAEIQSKLKEHIKPLFGAIQVGYDALPDDAARRALQALSIFRPKPDTFTEEAGSAVLDDARPKTVIRKLQDAGLAELYKQRGGDKHSLPYTMHRTVAEFAQEKLTNAQAEALHHRAAAYFANWLKDFDQNEDGQGDASDSGSYRYQYRYEDPSWQAAMDEFLYHVARSGDPRQAVLEFGSIYFSAFWWWGCFAEFPFCTKLLKQAATRRLSEEARAALDLLGAFDASYPKESEQDREAGWFRVEHSLTELRKLGGLEENVDGTSGSVRYTRALTDIFLAEACRFGRKDYDQAERLYRDAQAMLPDSDWSCPWAHYHLGDMYLDMGRLDDAGIEVARCLALAEAPQLMLKDRDNEVIANAWRLRLELALQLGKNGEALEGLQRSVLHGFAFQAVPEPPDEYTVPFYGQITARVARALQALCRNDRPRALTYCQEARDYWASYRVLAQMAQGALAEADVVGMLQAPTTDALCAYLFPAAPTDKDMRVQGSRYFNEAITMYNEKLGAL